LVLVAVLVRQVAFRLFFLYSLAAVAVPMALVLWVVLVAVRAMPMVLLN
jgi:hypothetical protein